MMQVDNTTDDIHVMEWRISGFSSCTLDVGEKLESPTLTAGSFYNTRWELVIYPKGRNEYTDFLCCFLRRDDREKCGPEVLHIEFEFSLLSFDGVATFKKTASEEFKRGISYGFDEYVKLEDIFLRREFLLQSSALTLRCKLRLLPPKTKQTSLHLFKTSFPFDDVTLSLTLDDFRSISKRKPLTLPIKASKDLLSLKVSMNKDEASAEQAKMDTNPETKETFLRMAIVKKKSKDPVYVTCWVKLLNTKSEIAVDKEVSHLFPKSDGNVEWVLPYFIDTDNLGDDCIENDSLHLDFDFRFCDTEPSSLQTSDLTTLKFSDDPKETTLMGDLVDLYETKKFSDVNLRVGNKLISAHKSVLAARCPRFDEIFTLLAKESTDCAKHIEEVVDVDEETMDLLLKFIYTDKLEDMSDEKCLLLYSAAQKYKISSLHFRCARFLRKNLSVKAVYKALLFAEEFCDSELKMAALDLILEHYQAVLLTPEWQTFTEEHEELSEQVMRHIRLKKQQQPEE